MTAWYGIRMSRALNNTYMLPLTHTLPADQRGPTGDVGKVGCGTCHRGAYKPLFGQSMLADYPELAGPRVPSAPEMPPAPVDARAASGEVAGMKPVHDASPATLAARKPL